MKNIHKLEYWEQFCLELALKMLLLILYLLFFLFLCRVQFLGSWLICSPAWVWPIGDTGEWSEGRQEGNNWAFFFKFFSSWQWLHFLSLFPALGRTCYGLSYFLLTLVLEPATTTLSFCFSNLGKVIIFLVLILLVVSCGTGAPTHGFTFVRQTLYHLRYSSCFSFFFFS
jgi:hypothetical protein